MEKPQQLNSFVLKSISYNMILQFSFRIFSFVLNALLFRSVSTELIGACNLHLALLYTTILFLSREAFRRPLPDLSSLKGDSERQALINSIWLAVPNGIVVSSVCGLFWAFLFDRPDENQVQHYPLAIFVCCLACLVELTGEVAFAIAQMLLMAKRRVLAEASNLFVFNLVFVGLAIYWPSLGALSYSVARLLNALILVIGSYVSLPTDIKTMPTSLQTVGFDWDYLKLVKAYYKQSIYKQILTEGERYLIAAFGLLTFSEAGIYDLINNLGSIIARFVFLPIEEASYILFTNSLKRGFTIDKQPDQKAAKEAKTYFELVTKIVSLVGITVLVYGQSYSALLLHIYGGSRLSLDTVCVNLLRFYCVYIFFLAINGITEGFFNATMSEPELNTHNKRLIIFSVVFLSSTFVLAKLFHVRGFLMANCVNMLVRIVVSSRHIRGFLSSSDHKYNPLVIYFPDFTLMVIYFVALLITKTSELFLYEAQHPYLHLIVGVFVFLVNFAAIFKFEHDLKNFVFKHLSNLLKKFKRA